jgi:hypothetical protein
VVQMTFLRRIQTTSTSRPPLFVNSVPALTLQNNDGPPLFVNSDAFVNIARLHAHVPLACLSYDPYQHWWCVRFELSTALLSLWTLLHQRMRCPHSPLCLQTPMAHRYELPNVAEARSAAQSRQESQEEELYEAPTLAKKK